jgi:hypothetical protein
MDQQQRILDEFNYNYGDDSNASYTCPSWAPIVGFTGIACAVVFASEYHKRMMIAALMLSVQS